MHLSHLIGVTDWADVERALVRHYPDARDSLDGYRETFFGLRRLRPVASAMRVCLRITFRPGLDDEPFLEVVGKNGTLNRESEDFRYLGEAEDSIYALSEAEFALELEPWSEWLGMEIDADALSRHLSCEIVAHCLWEMTCFGFDETAVGAQRQELKRRVDELNAMTEEEKKERLIPIEQVLGKLNG